LTDPERYRHRAGMSLTAIALAAPGFVLLFAPAEIGPALGQPAGSNTLLQVFGAALLGFAAATWTARATFVGGIYGRAVVAGNQAHFFIGALVLTAHAVRAGGPPAFWLLCAIYVAGAVWFSWLLWGGGERRRSGA
jgi:hypothetical protein